MLGNLQALRALAAIAVVVFHFGLLPGTALPFRIGAAGVDLFFVLSGFIIAYSSARDPRQFLTRRLIRILPPYWIATIIAALFTLEALPGREALNWLVQSLFYLPGPGGRPALIFVAWTLVYELAFYLIYAIALRSSTSRAPFVAIVLLLALAFAGLPGIAGPWPLLAEFALGLGVYLLAERAGDRAPAWFALALIAGGIATLAIMPRITTYDPDDYESLARVLSWGLPAGLIVLGAVLAEHRGRAVRSRLVLALGAASYAIYLLHPIVIGQLLKLPQAQPPASWALCIVATLLTAVASVVFFRLIERPMLELLRARLARRS